MAPLKGIAAWYPRERQASLSGWIMVAGGMGALAATTPLEIALRVTRLAHGVRGARGVDVRRRARASAWRVPDIARPADVDGPCGAVGGRRAVRHPRFWWIAPLGAFCMGSFMAIQGLWAVPWLMEVEGQTAPQRRGTCWS